MTNRQQPILITLTAPSCGGKSYLLNYIRDIAKMPCLISTTTRPPRANEVEGVDYYFITEEQSIQLAVMDQFAELAIYNGVRYGVTRKELKEKLSSGYAFLIIEPGGLEGYVQSAIDMGAKHLKYYIHTDPETRIERFYDRVNKDVTKLFGKTLDREYTKLDLESDTKEIIHASLTRFRNMLTTEMTWGSDYQWDRILFGTTFPEENLQIIQNDIRELIKS